MTKAGELADWQEITPAEAKRYYRIPAEILRIFAVAAKLDFTLYLKRKNMIRAVNTPGATLDQKVLLKIAAASDQEESEVEALIQRGDTETYRRALALTYKNLSDVVKEEIDLAKSSRAPVATHIDYSGKKAGPEVSVAKQRAGSGTTIGKRAPDFSLVDGENKSYQGSRIWAENPLMMVFYPGDFTPVCTKQMCNYRDQFADFTRFKLTILGISANTGESHRRFSSQFDIPFPLLSDPHKRVAKLFGATSFLMFGAVSRAVFIINQGGIVLYRYVEPTILSRRRADELVEILADLDAAKLLRPAAG